MSQLKRSEPSSDSSEGGTAVRKRPRLTPVARLNLGVLACVLLMWAGMDVQPAQPGPATPLEPIAAILDAFRSHSVVALGEGSHGNEQGHAFRLRLIRDRRFAAVVNDIVVEFGSARYQEVMDRFTRGEAVADEALRQAWRNTTVANPGWDRPIYEEFFRTVQAVNAALPRARRLRVLLGDPPIDWESVHTAQDLLKWGIDRDRFAADLIRREVLARNRRALVIYGDMHFQRRDVMANFEELPGDDLLLPILEREAHTSVFSVWTNTTVDVRPVDGGAATWPVPTLIPLRGSTLGAADFTFFYPAKIPRFRLKAGISRMTSPADTTLVPPAEWRSFAMERNFDALLYLGHPSTITISQLSPTVCSDRTYLDQRLHRMALGGSSQGEIDRLKTHCTSVTTR